MVTADQPASNDLQQALQHAAALLKRDSTAAAMQAREILAAYPDCQPATVMLATALRMQGRVSDALGTLEPLVTPHSDAVDLLYEYGLCLGVAGQPAAAVTTLESVVRLQPDHAAAWRSLGELLSASGDDDASDAALERHIALSTEHAELARAASHARRGEYAHAEPLLRDLLKRYPTDVNAIRLLADIGLKVGRPEDARKLLARCLELAPDFHLARHTYATALLRRRLYDEALAETGTLLKVEPNNPNYLLLKASVLVQKGDHAPALGIYEQLLGQYPRQPAAHMNYGHTLKTVGRVDDAVAAYRRNIALSRRRGEAYWSLANLKTFRFDDAEIEAMLAGIDDAGDIDDQAHLSFALGKACEDRADYAASFGHYERGNALRRQHHRYNAKLNVFDTARQMRALDAGFFAARAGRGEPSGEPIFVVGLPRAGSTLLEQILASHSMVEGTTELPDIIAISRKLGDKSRANPASKYPEILATLSAEQLSALGAGYLASTRIHRHGLAHFIDKMPNNFRHIGLIHLILPNARIVDARREPMAGCFSCYKQLFARGQAFTYSLTDVGMYYRDYIRLMDHWDEVLPPGRILRVQYEDMVADTEQQIRRLLDYCGLPFEEQCLRFYETRRAVRTPSSEQVRQPVYQQALAQWRHFEPWLGPLKAALGPVLERYPIE